MLPWSPFMAIKTFPKEIPFVTSPRDFLWTSSQRDFLWITSQRDLFWAFLKDFPHTSTSFLPWKQGCTMKNPPKWPFFATNLNFLQPESCPLFSLHPPSFNSFIFLASNICWEFYQVPCTWCGPPKSGFAVESGRRGRVCGGGNFGAVSASALVWFMLRILFFCFLPRRKKWFSDLTLPPNRIKGKSK